MDRILEYRRSMTRAFVLVGTALLLACTVSVDSEGGTQSRDLLDRLPNGATAIFWIDSEAMAAEVPPEQWDAYQDMLNNDEDLEDLQAFIDATGIDPRTDLRQIAVAAMPQSNDDAQVVILLSGSFDSGRLESFLSDAPSIEYEGRTMYFINDKIDELQRERNERRGIETDTVPSMDRDNSPGYITILDDTTLAAGTDAALRIAIDVEDGRRDSLQMDPHMNDLISDVAGEGQIWFVATKESWDRRLDDLGAGGAPMPTNAVESIETVTMSMRFDGGMNLRFAGIAGSPEDAEMLAQTINGWTAMGKMMLQQEEPELFAILDRGIRVANDDRTLQIEAVLSEADLEVLRRLAEEQ